MRAFPTSTNANEQVLLALGSDRTGRDDVKISRGKSQSTCSCRLIHAKSCDTIKRSVNAAQLVVSSFFDDG